MKLQLILSQSPSTMRDELTGIYPPLCLVWLGSYIKKELPSYEVEILDGEILSQQDLEGRINGDVVGFSVHAGNYSTALPLAEKAKKKGAKVIIGGPYASVIPQQILKKREFIDVVVVGDGEEALLNYVTGQPIEKIPNIVYRKRDKIKFNSSRNTNMNSVHLDYDLVNLEPYFERFKKDPEVQVATHFTKGGVVCSQKSCLWREKSGCVFCTIPGGEWRAKKVENVWQEIRELVENYKIDYIWDVSSSFTENKMWLDEFVKKKPRDLNPAFRIYARSSGIDQETAELLHQINCYTVYIGFEAADDKMLRALNKGETIKDHYRALECLAKYGTHVIPSFVLGAPGEGEDSLKNTVNFAKKIKNEFKNIAFIVSSPLVPLPGSRAFYMISQKMPNYLEMDLFNWEALRKDWASSFCNTSYEKIREANDEILSLSSSRKVIVLP